MTEKSKKEVIEQLERLQFLLDEALECDEYVEKGCKKEYQKKLKEVIISVKDLNGTPSVFKTNPVFPIDNSSIAKLKQEFEKKKKTLIFAIIPTAIFILIFFITNVNFFCTVSVIGIMAIIVCALMFSQSKRAYTENEKKYNESVQKSNQSFTEFRNALSNYEKEKAEGIQAAEKFAKEYDEAYNKYIEQTTEFGNSMQAAMDKIANNLKEAETIDFVPKEYYALVRPIIAMLKSGRADSYKEALNMAIEEDRQDKIEFARQLEEERRTQIMEEQAIAERLRAEEMERHNRELERQQRENDAAMLREQSRMNEAALREQRNQQSAAYKADLEARTHANLRCAKCAKHDSCGKARGNPNCGAFEPKRF